MGPPDGKCLDIDTVSQNRLYAIQKSYILKNGSKVLGVTHIDTISQNRLNVIQK